MEDIIVAQKGKDGWEVAGEIISGLAVLGVAAVGVYAIAVQEQERAEALRQLDARRREENRRHAEAVDRMERNIRRRLTPVRDLVGEALCGARLHTVGRVDDLLMRARLAVCETTSAEFRQTVCLDMNAWLRSKPTFLSGRTYAVAKAVEAASRYLQGMETSARLCAGRSLDELDTLARPSWGHEFVAS